MWHEAAGNRALVMGLGRFGGGLGVTRFLAQRGWSVLVTDLAPEAELAGPLAELGDLSVAYRLGEHCAADFAAADLVVVNPAVNPQQNRYVQAAREAGATLTSEIRLLIDHLPGGARDRVLGVTGTAGKSTVTAMLGSALETIAGQDARVWVGGNLGGSLLPQVDEIGQADWVVLELSSFMLAGLDEPGWSPATAVVTNIAPNHLDWHGSFEAYQAAKRVILRHQQPGDRAVLGPGVTDWPTNAGIERIAVDQPFAGELALPGEHNRWNAALAQAALTANGFDLTATANALSRFAGLAHRLELVAERDGWRAFNDSKATTPEAAMRALHSFAPGQAHLILGGYDKGSDLTELAQAAAGHAAAVYTIGDTGPAIAEAARAGGGNAPVHACGDLDSAVQEARQRIEPGQVLLLSPGCASWDQFTNFETRGERFRACLTPAP
jgi:UDP-N-acetylmuramoylalanine--D-glutamate ligase